MKKSVAVMFILVFLALFFIVRNEYQPLTGFQVLELPEPPPPPGMTQEALPNATPTPTPANATPTPVATPAPTIKGDDLASVIARLEALEQKVGVMPAWEERLKNAEAQISNAANMASRLDAMQSQIDALKVDVDNLKSAAARPSVDMPTFVEGIQGLKKNTILSISLSVLLLIIVAGMITTSIISRRQEMLQSKQLIKQYLANYQKAGYQLNTLRMHLRACGWEDNFVDECIKELPR